MAMQSCNTDLFRDAIWTEEEEKGENTMSIREPLRKTRTQNATNMSENVHDVTWRAMAAKM